MTEEELARHDSKTLLQLLLSADARCDALTAERDGLLRCVTDNHVALCRAEAAEAERDRLRGAGNAAAMELRVIAGMDLMGASATAWNAARKLEAALKGEGHE